jgi:hypothetical protein
VGPDLRVTASKGETKADEGSAEANEAPCAADEMRQETIDYVRGICWTKTEIGLSQ